MNDRNLEITEHFRLRITPSGERGSPAIAFDLEQLPLPAAEAGYLERVRDALLAARPDATPEHLAAVLQDAAVRSPAMRRLLNAWYQEHPMSQGDVWAWVSGSK